jgi:hypothetical protein
MHTFYLPVYDGASIHTRFFALYPIPFGQPITRSQISVELLSLLLDIYKSMAKCSLGDGKSAFFWTDL